jgi:hypothetical protein
MEADFYLNNTTAILNFEAITARACKRHIDLLVFYGLLERSTSKDSEKILLACILDEFFNTLKQYIVKPIIYIKQNAIETETLLNLIRKVCTMLHIVIIEHPLDFNDFILKRYTDEISVLLTKKINEKYTQNPRNFRALKKMLVKYGLTHLHESVFNNNITKSALLK